MLRSTRFDRAMRAVSDRSSRAHMSWRPKLAFRFAHNAIASLLLFVIAFLFMGVPVFASAGGPPVARYVVVGYSHTTNGGSGITPIKHSGIYLAGGSGINPVR